MSRFGEEEPTADLLNTARRGPRRRRPSETPTVWPSTDEATLVCVGGADVGRTFRIGREPLLIGRGPSAAAGLESLGVSRHHALVTMAHGSVFIEDLGSTNGTFVDGARVSGRVEVPIGASLRFGTTAIFVLRRDHEPLARWSQTPRWDSTEQVVAGFAHDFNNVLGVIVGGLESIANLVPRELVEVSELVDELIREALGASGLARRLVHFREPTAPLPDEEIAFETVVDETLAVARHVIPSNIALVVDVAPGMAYAGSRDEMKQVLLNLVLNGRDAMPSGGTLTIGARLVALTEAGAAARHLATPGEYIELVVADTGFGMSEETRARVFDPFFTTKPAGSGVGLAMARTIVVRHGGAIAADSTMGAGAAFRVWLPATPPPLPAPPVPAPPLNPSPRK